MNERSPHHVKVVNYGMSCEETPVIEIGDYPLSMDSQEEAEACAAAINARIDAALADRDAAWERAVMAEHQPDFIYDEFNWRCMIEQASQRLDAESNPQHLPTSDEESNHSEKPNSWSEVRQRLRDAGADRWDRQRSDREVEADLNVGGELSGLRPSKPDAGISESVIRDRDAGDEDPGGWPIEESLADFDKRCQHEQDGRDGYVERMLD